MTQLRNHFRDQLEPDLLSYQVGDQLVRLLGQLNANLYDQLEPSQLFDNLCVKLATIRSVTRPQLRAQLGREI